MPACVNSYDRPLSERFANLKRFVPFVAAITITPVEKLMPD
jgi:hypothetical protein